LGKNYVHIESIGCRCPSDGNILASEARPTYKNTAGQHAC